MEEKRLRARIDDPGAYSWESVCPWFIPNPAPKDCVGSVGVKVFDLLLYVV